MKKYLSVMALVFALILSILTFSGCGSDTTISEGGKAESDKISEDEKSEVTTEKKEELPKISMKDIDWSVDSSIIDGERFVSLEYTNNTDYTIVEFDVQFKQKSSVTEEEKNKFFDDIKTILEIDDSDTDDLKKLEKLKQKDITMRAEAEAQSKHGNTVSGVELKYYEGYQKVRDLGHYSLVEPDIATIKFISDSKIITVYYDFLLDKYTTDSKTDDAYFWPENGLENSIPKPEAECVKDYGLNDRNTLRVLICGWNKNDFNDYVKSCKEYGFTVDVTETETMFLANSAKGYNLNMFYDEDDCEVSVTVDRIAQS